jgi:hypothetical protein
MPYAGTPDAGTADATLPALGRHPEITAQGVRANRASPQRLVEDIVNQCSGNLWRPVPAKKMEPQMNANEARINDLSRLVIGCALAVANTLGSEFVEKVYENALAHELRKSGLAVAQQRSVIVRYDGVVVGEYTTDGLAGGGRGACGAEDCQGIGHYPLCPMPERPQGDGLRLCLLLNFGKPRLEIKRVVQGL